MHCAYWIEEHRHMFSLVCQMFALELIGELHRAEKFHYIREVEEDRQKNERNRCVHLYRATAFH